MSRRIVIMAGGTGGHVFPALAVAQELQERGWNVSWLGTRNGLESRVVPENNIEIDWMVVEGIRGKGMAAKFLAVFKMLKACRQARRILLNRKPEVVLGMGGFVSAPGALMAKLLGIPVVIHEQNRIPGTANRLLARLVAKRVLEAFPNSFTDSAHAICTGNPLRKTFMTQPEKAVVPFDIERPLNILILGGSQGAKILNDTVPEALSSIDNIEIRHQTGPAMQNEVAERYRSLNKPAQALAFINDMANVYQWADLIICRAGAMTVSEVSACGLPAIFVPLLNAIDDHQTANARYLSEAGAALLLPQTELNTENLRNAIEQALNNLPTMRLAAKKLARLDATHRVTDICIAEAAL